MTNNSNLVYVVFRCPKCKGLGEKYPPGKYDAVSDKDIYKCADCGVEFIIRFVPLTSAAELLRAPAEPEQTCPVCFGDRERLNNDGLMHKCEFCDGTGKSNRSGRG